MLTEQQIQQALRASRAERHGVTNPHGPLGLEHLAEAVARLQVPAARSPDQAVIERPISLPLETWEKLDQIARQTRRETSQPVTTSAVVAALLEQCVSKT